MTAERMADTRRCPFCEQWIPMPARFAHKAFEAHKMECFSASAAAPSPMRRWCPEHDRYCPFQGAEHIEETGQTLPSTFSVKRAYDTTIVYTCPTCGRGTTGEGECSPCRAFPQTVKRADLFGNVIDTHQTETELNGFRPTQGALL